MTVESTSLADDRRKTFVLQEIQPDLLGLMDGSVPTLAPIFARAGPDGSAAKRVAGRSGSVERSCAPRNRFSFSKTPDTCRSNGYSPNTLDSDLYK
jgi:hypothetical protein